MEYATDHEADEMVGLVRTAVAQFEKYAYFKTWDGPNKCHGFGLFLDKSAAAIAAVTTQTAALNGQQYSSAMLAICTIHRQGTFTVTVGALPGHHANDCRSQEHQVGPKLTCHYCGQKECR